MKNSKGLSIASAILSWKAFIYLLRSNSLSYGPIRFSCQECPETGVHFVCAGQMGIMFATLATCGSDGNPWTAVLCRNGNCRRFWEAVELLKRKRRYCSYYFKQHKLRVKSAVKRQPRLCRLKSKIPTVCWSWETLWTIKAHQDCAPKLPNCFTNLMKTNTYLLPVFCVMVFLCMFVMSIVVGIKLGICCIRMYFSS
jgi:hypothetical protein